MTGLSSSVKPPLSLDPCEYQGETSTPVTGYHNVPLNLLLALYFFIYIFIYLFIYLFFGGVFVAVHGLSLVAESRSGGYSLLRCVGFSLQWLLLLQSMGPRT